MPSREDWADPEFICRFWIGYWQGRLLVLQAYAGTPYAELPDDSSQ